MNVAVLSYVEDDAFFFWGGGGGFAPNSRPHVDNSKAANSPAPVRKLSQLFFLHMFEKKRHVPATDAQWHLPYNVPYLQMHSDIYCTAFPSYRCTVTFTVQRSLPTDAQ